MIARTLTDWARWLAAVALRSGDPCAVTPDPLEEPALARVRRAVGAPPSASAEEVAGRLEAMAERLAVARCLYEAGWEEHAGALAAGDTPAEVAAAVRAYLADGGVPEDEDLATAQALRALDALAAVEGARHGR